MAGFDRSAIHMATRDFLTDEQWSMTAGGFEKIVMQPIHSGGLQHVYAFGDGTSYHSTDATIDRPHNDGQPDLDGVLPSLRGFARAILDNSEIANFVEDLGGWSSFTMRAYLYPSGSGLTWHTDRKCVAAYVYYLHETWDPAWGGELLFSTSKEDESVCKTSADTKLYPSYPGVSAASGIFYLPLPNSFILFRGGVSHCVKKVEPASGNRARASISGFFYND